jgi:hypothetical protein
MRKTLITAFLLLSSTVALAQRMNCNDVADAGVSALYSRMTGVDRQTVMMSAQLWANQYQNNSDVMIAMVTDAIMAAYQIPDSQIKMYGPKLTMLSFHKSVKDVCQKY